MSVGIAVIFTKLWAPPKVRDHICFILGSLCILSLIALLPPPLLTLLLYTCSIGEELDSEKRVTFANSCLLSDTEPRSEHCSCTSLSHLSPKHQQVIKAEAHPHLQTRVPTHNRGLFNIDEWRSRLMCPLLRVLLEPRTERHLVCSETLHWCRKGLSSLSAWRPHMFSFVLSVRLQPSSSLLFCALSSRYPPETRAPGVGFSCTKRVPHFG